MTRPYAALFEPIAVGSVELSSRIVSLPHGQNGLPLPQLADYMEHLARNHVGQIVLGGSVVAPESWEPGLYPLYDEGFADGVRETSRRVHAAGSRIIAQLLHMGHELLAGAAMTPFVSPSPIPSAVLGEVGVGIPKADLAGLRDSYLRAARTMARAEVDGFEIHAAHNYLLHQFLWPSTNRREDEYGGSLSNRARLMTEIITDIRGELGGKILGVRLPFGEVEGMTGIAVEDLIELVAGWDRDRLIDYVTVTVPSEPSRYVLDASFPSGGMRAVARRLREKVNARVVVSQRIDSPALATGIVESGDADLVGLGRALLADPEWARKAREGAGSAIRPCIRSVNCRSSYGGCDVNPTAYATTIGTGAVAPVAGRPGAPVLHESRPVRAGSVVIVGGGPAGCEAAVAVARSGAGVTLFDAAPELGGAARVAGGAPHRSPWRQYADYLDGLVRRTTGIEVRAGERAEAGAIASLDPDLVIVAVGAEQRPPAPGIDRFVDSYDLVRDPELAASWQRVLVLDEGGRWDALNAIEILLSKDVEAIHVTPHERIADRVNDETRHSALRRILGSGLDVHTSSTAEIRDGKVEVTTNGARAPRAAGRVDAVVWCGLLRPVSGPVGPSGVKTVRIGDCLTPRGLRRATLEGRVAGAQVAAGRS